MNKNILYIHQASELYGSDKTLLDLLTHVDKSKYKPYVILPNKGLLTDELEKLNIPVYIMPVMKISRGMNKFNFIALLKNLNSLYKIKQLDKKIKFDIIYSNTLATLLGAIYSLLFSKKHIWHIHEIIEKPKFLSFFFAWIVNISSNKVIFNSTQSYNHLTSKLERLTKFSIVVHNGISPNTNSMIKKNEMEFKLALIGRIHKWKGHLLLIDAFKNLTQKYRNISLYIVGSNVPGNDSFKIELNDKISEYKLNNKIHFIEFCKDISNIYNLMDIIIVPSINPEPFGMVTIEAMNHMRPVIASAHGGTLDIINDNEDGLLFEPNNSKDLEKKIALLIDNPEKRNKISKAGYEKVKSKFSVENYVTKITELYDQL
jgi:glycosyltransferase involved in cell wall biosynthesis